MIPEGFPTASQQKTSEEKSLSLSEYCVRVYEKIRDVNERENRAVRRRELFNLLGWSPERDKNRLDRCISKLESYNLIITTNPQHRKGRPVYIVVRDREDLLPRVYELTEEHIKDIAKGFMLLTKSYHELSIILEDVVKKKMIISALQHILTGENYGYLRDLLDQGRIDEFKDKISTEAKRILTLKEYRLRGRCEICDPFLKLSDKDIRRINEWIIKLRPWELL